MKHPEQDVVVYQWGWTKQWEAEQERRGKTVAPIKRILAVGNSALIQPDNIIKLTGRDGREEQFSVEEVWIQGNRQTIKFPPEIEEKRQLRWNILSVARDLFSNRVTPVYTSERLLGHSFDDVRTIEIFGNAMVLNPHMPWGNVYVVPKERVTLMMQNNQPPVPMFDLTPVSP